MTLCSCGWNLERRFKTSFVCKAAFNFDHDDGVFRCADCENEIDLQCVECDELGDYDIV